jgi:hypothetical protein
MQNRFYRRIPQSNAKTNAPKALKAQGRPDEAQALRLRKRHQKSQVCGRLRPGQKAEISFVGSAHYMHCKFAYFIF